MEKENNNNSSDHNSNTNTDFLTKEEMMSLYEEIISDASKAMIAKGCCGCCGSTPGC